MTATFDGDELLITLDAPTAGVLQQTAEQVYDESKQWFLGGENSRFPFPFSVSGGEDITAVEKAGQYYFLRNDLGWRIRSTDADQDVFWSGNLIPTDLDIPIIVARTGRTVLHLGLQPLTTVISAGSGLSTAEALQLSELWKKAGLDITDPFTRTTDDESSFSGDIDIDVSGDGVTTSTLTRQP